jgi:carbon-monoxide dehydrogenase medium subunit
MLAIHRSRKLIPPFRLLRPRSAAEAAALQGEAPGRIAFMAGGIDLVNRLKFGAAPGTAIDTVVHLGDVPGLRDIVEHADGITIGALVTHQALQESALIRARLPALAQTWDGVANIRVRLKGTVGGNLMARDPLYDFPLAVMAAGARLRFVDPDGASRLVAASALAGPVALPGLLTAIELPRPDGLHLVFDRALRPVVSLAVGLDRADGMIRSGRVAVGCAHAAPVVVPLPIGGGVGLEAAPTVAQLAAAALPPPVTDSLASGDYRRRMVAVLTRRALQAAAA